MSAGDDGGNVEDFRDRGRSWHPRRSDRDGETPDDASCPVIPVGHDKGVNYFLTNAGQFRELRDEQLRGVNIVGLFGTAAGWLVQRFPKRDPRGTPLPETGQWIVSEAQAYLIARAQAEGLFNPAERIRGIGTWKARDGSLIVHAGDEVLIGGAWRKAGFKHEGFVYSAWPAVTRPAAKPATEREIADYFQFLDRWAWVEPRHARMLYIGWQAAQFVLGALTWRPHLQITGPSEAGKTTLDKLSRGVIGTLAVGRSASTEAAIRQMLLECCRPVFIDEIEASKPLMARALIDFARIASNDDQSDVGRGSADGRAVQYPARASFSFSSVLPLRFEPQDLLRITVLRLGRPRGGTAPDGAPEAKAIKDEVRRFGKMGPAIYARMLKAWPRLQKNLAMVGEALADLGGRARVADQLGTLLACGYTLRHDKALDRDTAAELVKDYQTPELVGDADQADERAILDCLLTRAVFIPHGINGTQRELIGQMVREGGKRRLGSWDKALRDHGLGIEYFDPGDKAKRRRPDGLALAISTQHEGVRALLEGSRWEHTDVHDVLRYRIPGADTARDPDTGESRKVSFGGIKSRATLIPWKQLPLADDEAAGDGGTSGAGAVPAGESGVVPGEPTEF